MTEPSNGPVSFSSTACASDQAGFVDERGAAVDPLRAEARVLLELPRGLRPPHGHETLERPLAQLDDAPLEQENEERSRNQEGEKEPEQQP